MPKTEWTYKANFIEGMRIYMAKHQVPDIKAMSAELDMNYMTLYKILSGPNNPSVELCAKLCDLAGYSGNWMFLNIGDKEMATVISLESIQKELRSIRKEIGKVGHS
jgi:DNA-binding XRE family transcriptional regulator